MAQESQTDPDAGWDDPELIDFMADRAQEEQETPPPDAGEETDEMPPPGEGDNDPEDPDDEDGDV